MPFSPYREIFFRLGSVLSLVDGRNYQKPARQESIAYLLQMFSAFILHNNIRKLQKKSLHITRSGRSAVVVNVPCSLYGHSSE
ncbi:hypothetical protein PNOK_0562500 [Pyrrhoderma noxium]|uniref:Uncharacterized protein n=1 Tax=Pyrrhoderma noxium TaxID=2282107 RepID=A0A286UGN2_9AGAM|nr:hypothetical protein PNOK_0562500 [Pyrrhoderma noxium]